MKGKMERNRKEQSMIARLIEKIKKTEAPVCVGLDPQLSFIPEKMLKEAFAAYGETPEAVSDVFFRFNKEIIDAVWDLVPAVKPQIAMYEQFGIPGLQAYVKTVQYCQEKGLIVIGDCKRGDIGSTSASYAAAHIGRTQIGADSFTGFGTDMATVNPYFGTDGVKPFLDACNACDKGIFILVKTSNPSSGEFQDRLVDGKPLYELVAEKVAEWGNESMDGDYSNVGAVVGATYPEVGKRLRGIMPHTYFLVPGYGAQGGTAEDLKCCFNKDGLGAIVNSSRGILAAWKKELYASYGEEHFAEASRRAVTDMITDIRSVL